MTTLFALFVIPGFVILLLGRARIGHALVGAIPVSYGVVTIATYVVAKFGIRWSTGVYVLSAVVIGALLFLVGLAGAAIRRRRAWKRGEFPEPRRRGWKRLAPRRHDHGEARIGFRETIWYLLPTLAVLVSSWAIATMILNELGHQIGGLENIFQGWDAHWHVNYLRFIADTGLASPEDAGVLRNPESGAPMYYPSAWHAIAALVYSLTGSGAPEVYNLVQIGGHALFFPLGVAALAFSISRRRFGLPTAATAATVAALMTGLFPGLPYVEIMVAATPAAASMGLSGTVVLLIFAAVRRPIIILPAALGLIGLGGIHPSGLATAAIIVIFYWLFELLWRPVRGRIADLLPLATIAILGAATLLPQLLSISGEADDISAFTFQTHDSRAENWGKAATLQVRHVQDWGIRWVLLAVMILGAIALIARLVVWPVLAWAGYMVLCVNAMNVFGNDVGGWLRAAGSIYYNDPRRLGVVMAMIGAAAAGVGVAALAQGLVALLGRLIEPVTDPRGEGAGSLRVAAALVAAVAAGSWAYQAAPEYAVAAGGNQRWGLLVDTHDLEAFHWLAQQPEAYDGLILTNPDEGSGWMYGTDGLPSTARHYLAPPKQEKKTQRLFGSVHRAGISTQVDQDLADLGIRYLYVSPGSYWPWQKQFPAFEKAEPAPGLELVYVDRQIRIYAVRAQFSAAQLEQIIADSPHPPEPAQLFTRASEKGY